MAETDKKSGFQQHIRASASQPNPNSSLPTDMEQDKDGDKASVTDGGDSTPGIGDHYLVRRSDNSWRKLQQQQVPKARDQT